MKKLLLLTLITASTTDTFTYENAELKNEWNTLQSDITDYKTAHATSTKAQSEAVQGVLGTFTITPIIIMTGNYMHDELKSKWALPVLLTVVPCCYFACQRISNAWHTSTKSLKAHQNAITQLKEIAQIKITPKGTIVRNDMFGPYSQDSLWALKPEWVIKACKELNLSDDQIFTLAEDIFRTDVMEIITTVRKSKNEVLQQKLLQVQTNLAEAQSNLAQKQADLARAQKNNLI